MTQNRSRNRMLPALIIAATACIIAGAFMSNSAYAEVNPGQSLRPGSWSLLFEVENDFQLDAFESFMFAFKRHYSQSSAMRVGVTLEYSSSNGDWNDEEDGLTMGFRDPTGHTFEVDLAALYVIYPSGIGRINPFLGLGPDLRYEKVNSKDMRTSNYYSNGVLLGYATRETEASSYTLSGGLRGVIGVEWFATSNVSLMAEYGLSIGRSYKETEQTEEDKTYERQNGSFVEVGGSPADPDDRTVNIQRSFGLTSNAVQLGLTVYF